MKQDGTKPEARELFTIARMLGPIVSKVSFITGTKSKGHMVGFMLVTVSLRNVRLDKNSSAGKNMLG